MTPSTTTNSPDSVPYVDASIETLLTGAAYAPLAELGFLSVKGEDRVRWLNGMATNSIQALKPGEGCYNFFLNAKGRIQADATAWMLEDSILLEGRRDHISALMAHLDHFIIMDDVELTDLSSERSGLTLIGPQARQVLKDLGLPSSALTDLEKAPTLVHTTIDNHPVDLILAYSTLIPRFELWSTPAITQRLFESLKLANIPEAASEAIHQLRILEGLPLYGSDISDKDLPQETAQARALHFAKGCYLGQEIVERIRSRGNVHRTFAGFRLIGAVPAAHTPLFADNPDQPAGEITSAAEISLQSGPIVLALGFIRREVLDRGVQLTYQGGTAIPTALPYKP